jgi:hypothetical protein
LAVQGLKKNRNRPITRPAAPVVRPPVVEKEADWASVPSQVTFRIKAALVSPLVGDPLDSPASLVSHLVAASLALPDHTPVPKEACLEGELPDVLQKRADGGITGLFTPSIPVDAFNNAVWQDAIPNPYGTRSTFGDNSQRLGTPPQVAAVVTGLISGAGAARESSHVSPMDVAMAAGAAAGKGWLGGLVLGKTLGALAGLPPEGQERLKQVGLFGGMLTGAVRELFGKGD